MKLTREQVEAMSGPELVAFHNQLFGVKPVKRFASRADGIKRVLAALGDQPAETPAPAAAPEPGEASKTAVPAAAAPKGAKRASKGEKAAPAPSNKSPRGAKGHEAKRALAAAAHDYRVPKGVERKEPKGGKRAEFYAALATKDGVDYATALKRWGWSPADVRDCCGQMARHLGIAIRRDDKGVFRLAK